MTQYGMQSDIPAVAGMLADINPRTISSYFSTRRIRFGCGLFVNPESNIVNDRQIVDKAVIALADYGTAGHSIVFTVNGKELSPIQSGASVQETCDNVASFLNLATPEIFSEVDGNNVNVNVEGDTALTLTMAVDGSDVSSSKVTLSTSSKFIGVAVYHATTPQRDTDFDSVINVLEKGNIWGVLDENVEPSLMSDAYVTPNGVFTTSNASGNVLVGKFKTENKNGIAEISL